MAIADKIPDIEIPDVSKMELPKIDMGRLDMSKIDVGKARDKARDRARDNVSKARSSMRGAVNDRLGRNDMPSPWLFIVGGVLAGMSIGYFLATSDWFAPRLKDAVGQARNRIDQMRNNGMGSNEDDLGPIVTEYEMTAVMAEPTEPQTVDPLATGTPSEQPYAI